MFTFASRPVRVRIAAGLSLVVAVALIPALAHGASAETSAAASLDRPVVIAPTDVSVVLKDVVLSWAPVLGATAYNVQVGTDEQWSDTPTYTATSVGSRLTLPTWLPHASYVWRVAATAKGATSRWSTNGTFTKGWLDRPDAQSPSAGERVIGVPNFRWSALADASSYELQVSTCPTFNESQSGPNPYPPCNPPSPTAVAAPGTVDNNPTQDQQQPIVETCFTSHTEYTPFIEQAQHAEDNPGECYFDIIRNGYPLYWRVRGLDKYAGTASDVDTTPASSAGISHLPAPTDGKPDARITSTCPGPGPSASPSSSPSASASPSGSPSPSPSATGPTPGSCTPTHEGERSAWSVTRTFDVTIQVSDTDYNFLPKVQTKPLPAGICADRVCSDFPTISWDGVRGASSYRVYVSLDASYSNIQRVVDTYGTQWTPTDTFKENNAGQAYYYVVQPCSRVSGANDPNSKGGCGAVTSDPPSFRKASAAQSVISPSDATITNDRQITFSWRDYADSLKATNGDRRIEASAYRLQVTTAADPDFNGTPIEDVVVDGALCAPVSGAAITDKRTQTAVQACTGSASYQRADTDVVTHTSDAVAYPDGDLLWRVQVVDPSGRKLRWSTVRTLTIDTVHPTVTMTPASNISVTQPLTVQFSEPVIGLTPATLSLTPRAPVLFTQSDSRTVVLTPTAPLALAARYTLNVARTITDLAGNDVQGSAPSATVNRRADDPSPAIAYGGAWSTYASSNAYNRGIHRSVPTRSAQTSATVTTYGTGALVIGCMTPSNGIMDVYVDGKLMVRRDTYRSYSGCGIYLARVTGLAPGMHRVQVRGTGLKGSRARGTAVAVDAIDAL